MMDLVVRNARLRGAQGLTDLAVEGGILRKIGPALEVRGREEIDAGGNLTTPPLCDPHLHLDAVLSVGVDRL